MIDRASSAHAPTGDVRPDVRESEDEVETSDVLGPERVGRIAAHSWPYTWTTSGHWTGHSVRPDGILSPAGVVSTGSCRMPPSAVTDKCYGGRPLTSSTTMVPPLRPRTTRCCLSCLLQQLPAVRKPTLLLPLLLVSIFFVLLNSKIRYVVEPPSYYRKFWPPLTVPSDLQPATSPSSLTPVLSTEPPACKPKNNAVFLKLHKCASSTVQNLFMRYGDYRNLTFVLPKKSNYMGHPDPFSASFAPDPVKYNVTYNLLVHHCRFNHDGMRRLMPRDTVYVTVLRDPVDLFESMYSYYGLFSFYKLPLERIGLLPKSSALFRRRFTDKFGINQMLFDLGLNYTDFFNVSAVQRYIDFLDKVFGLVMLAERMDESLVLLKDLMCWQMDDVVAFKLNARNAKFKTRLSPGVRAKLRKVNMADQMLYGFFAARFELRVREYGKERMLEDLALLRNRTEEWYSACVKRQELLRSLKSRHQQESNPRVMAFMPKNNTNATCKALTAPELDFTDHLREKQPFYLLEARAAAKVASRRVIRRKRVH